MALFLEILDGELKGTRTPIREGLTIGRKQGLLTIRDSKLSSKHASVELRADGELWIIDQGSVNGIKTAAGRVRELKLEAGTTFTLGRTPFQVISSEKDVGEADTPTSVVAATVTRTFWDNVRELAERATAEAKVVKREIMAFEPVVRLKFTRGLQAGTEWTLGYGPRTIGVNSVDLPLEDTTLPPFCFRLEPQPHGVLFRNESEREVRLNGKWVQTELLKDGDVIEIVNTQIQVILENTD